MVDQLTALKELDKAVVGGKCSKFEPLFEFAFYPIREQMTDAYTASDAFFGSLDASKKLHDAVLPRWDIQVGTYDDELFEASVAASLKVETYDGVATTMACAWLLAIIRAKIAEMEGK